MAYLAHSPPSPCRLTEVPICEACGGYGKPDIVFFGEDLPNVFHRNIKADCAATDLIIVIGTSLQVNPVASIPDMVSSSSPRVLINNELVGTFDTSPRNYRDVVELGNCDDAVKKICDAVGWTENLMQNYESSKIEQSES